MAGFMIKRADIGPLDFAFARPGRLSFVRKECFDCGLIEGRVLRTGRVQDYSGGQKDLANILVAGGYFIELYNTE